MLSLSFLMWLTFGSFVCANCAFWSGRLFKYLYWSRPSHRRLTGSQVARQILEQNKLNQVMVQLDPHRRTSSYDPRQKKVYLAPRTSNSSTLGAIAMAAHECGHAIQNRSTNIGFRFSQGGLAVYLGCLVFLLVFPFIWLVILGFAAAVVYGIETLRCEADASQKGFNSLRQLELIELDEVGPVKKLLQASFSTYIFGLFLFFIILISFLAFALNYNSLLVHIPLIGGAVMMLLPSSIPARN